MKKAIAILAFCALLVAGVASADKVSTVWAAQTLNVQSEVDTTGYKTAQVTISAVSGSPDGTATIYYVAPNGERTLLKSYATPTTAKTYAGQCGTKLVLALTGNSTGAVGAVVVLK